MLLDLWPRPYQSIVFLHLFHSKLQDNSFPSLSKLQDTVVRPAFLLHFTVPLGHPPNHAIPSWPSHTTDSHTHCLPHYYTFLPCNMCNLWIWIATFLFCDHKKMDDEKYISSQASYKYTVLYIDFRPPITLHLVHMHLCSCLHGSHTNGHVITLPSCRLCTWAFTLPFMDHRPHRCPAASGGTGLPLICTVLNTVCILCICSSFECLYRRDVIMYHCSFSWV